MALIFREAHAAPDKKQINEEWFVLENAGATSVNTGGLQVIAGRKGKRGSVLGVIDPGFMLQPGREDPGRLRRPREEVARRAARARGDAHLPPVPARGAACTARGRSSAWR